MQADRELRAESLETLRALARKCPRADHRMFLADALFDTGRLDEAAQVLDRMLADHQDGPDYVRRHERKVVARARRLREDIERARRSS